MTRSQPTVGPQSVICQNSGEHMWGGLSWNEHVDGDDCVLELESGDIPATGGNAAAIPWNTDITYTKIIVSGHVTTTDNQSLFAGSSSSSLRIADVANLDTSDATTLRSFFSDQPNLTTITGLGQWDTSNVTDMCNVFNGNSTLTGTPGIENWDTSNVTTMNRMFGFCPRLTRLNLSKHGKQWDTSKVTDMGNMFMNDAELTTIGGPGLEIPPDANTAPCSTDAPNCYVASNRVNISGPQAGRHSTGTNTTPKTPKAPPTVFLNWKAETFQKS
ncbi:BspA family leucine-rich repeat surface protein [Bifidobacterium sp. ESL0790]|uniref:BspA family leucine-rich repeat surface protein n=1 Tax=Bifidobacterium sp. ESL0790 TaxID=2983233 RepID=UPI0023F9430B|nr:BspA family leucine-rich repeat surface protein [Bifidobacterium sp. ESL0790]WEV71860.1 BspA family leucine-rich repeat surface protein [Bifidobacterium sp. ESL0790]